MKKYITIPESGFASLSPASKTETVMVSMRENDTITLSHFSVIQLIAGLAIATKEMVVKTTLLFTNNVEILRVAGKLYEAGLAPHLGTPEEALVKLDVNRDEVKIMYELLKLRMTHCEQQRDEENANPDLPKQFNPDTYIGQKLLLLDLREWLALEAIAATDMPTHYRPRTPSSVEE